MKIQPMLKPLSARKLASIGCLNILLLHTSNAMAIEPPDNLRAVVNTPSEIAWEWNGVNDAVQYEITIDGLFYGLTSGTQLTTDGHWPGEHSLRVRAIDANGQYSLTSGDIKTNTTLISDNTDSNSVTNNPPINSSGAVDPASFNYPEVYEKTGYALSFSDEFEGSSLNSDKWNTQLRWDGEFNGERYEYRVINGEDQFYVNIFSDDQEHLTSIVPSYNPFELDGSRLAIRAQRNPLKTSNQNAAYGPLNLISTQQEFLSGVISTYDKFTQKYGYFEARIKIPGHVGAFPAFWLHHQRREDEDTRKTEIDIMENLGHAPWYIYNSFHHFDNVSATYSGDANFVRPMPDGQIFNGTDFSLDYHTYAVQWEPGYVAWFIDGEKVSEINDDNVNHEELYLILNLAMGGFWTNFPETSGGLGRDSDNFFPSFDDLNSFSNPALEIDYVRVYERI